MCGLCAYIDDDKDMVLLEGLADLRIADAKHRLAYVLTRAAFVDIKRDRGEQAIERANEALACARLLQRDTEALMAHLALLSAGDRSEDHGAAIQSLIQQPVAVWARNRAKLTFAEPT